MIAAIGLVAGAWMIERRGRERSEAAELVTAAGLIFLLGAGLVSLAGAARLALLTLRSRARAALLKPSLFWDLVLLVGSIALVAVGSFARLRGTVYVGAAGILTFVFLVGFDLDDDSPAGKRRRLAPDPARFGAARDRRQRGASQEGEWVIDPRRLVTFQ